MPPWVDDEEKEKRRLMEGNKRPAHVNNEDKLGRGAKLIMSFHPNPLQDSPSSSSLKPTPPVPYPQKDPKNKPDPLRRLWYSPNSYHNYKQ
jgi:hypothetical protein